MLVYVACMLKLIEFPLFIGISVFFRVPLSEFYKLSIN